MTSKSSTRLNPIDCNDLLPKESNRAIDSVGPLSNSKRTKKASLSAGACVAGVGLASMQAGAAPITIANHSFENVDAITPYDWSPDAFSDLTRTYGAETTLAPIDGVRMLTLNNQYGRYETGQITNFQITSAGQELSLTVGVGNYRNNQMPASHYYGTINIQLSDDSAGLNAVDIATNDLSNPNAFTPTAPETSFADATLTYTTTGADIGKFVGVRFDIGSDAEVGSKQAYYDNVRLNAIPEPSTMLLMGLAFGVMGFQRIVRRGRRFGRR